MYLRSVSVKSADMIYMSYSIHVYPIALLEKTQAASLDFHQVMNFIEKEENLVEFDADEMDMIIAHLERRDYKQVRESRSRADYENSKYPSVTVMLTSTGLFFNARGEDVMEISMTAGEFGYYGRLKGRFAVLDPQNNGWQIR